MILEPQITMKTTLFYDYIANKFDARVLIKFAASKVRHTNPTTTANRAAPKASLTVRLIIYSLICIICIVCIIFIFLSVNFCVKIL